MEWADIKKPGLAEFAAVLRLPFISVSILAFVFGSLIDRNNFNIFTFFLGLVSAIATHIGANLINDYADSKSGVDWQDLKPYKLFGGSKFIQSGLLEEKFYLRAAVFCFILAFFCVLALTMIIGQPHALLFYPLIMFLGWAYSYKPLRLSYRRLGEPVIFLLFGPALVMGGYFIQTGIFPDLKSFLLSLPFGILTLSILFANEIPDYPEDIKSGKITWVSFLGAGRSYLFYLALITCAFITIAVNLRLGLLGKTAYLSFIFMLPAIKAARILKNHCSDKEKLVISARLTILVHTLVSMALIAGIL
jgi:1,4-dihydroxy-2-naphthoate polyprenyltransferase